MTDSLLRGLLHILNARVGTVLIMIVLVPVLTRLLGSDGYGNYAFLMAIHGFLMVVTDAGLFDGIRKFVAERPSNPRETTEVLGFYFRIGIALAIIVATAVGLVAYSPLGRSFLPPGFPTYLLLVALMIVGTQLVNLGRGSLMGMGLEHVSEPLFLSRKAVFAVLGVVLVASGTGLEGLLMSDVAASLLVIPLYLYILHRGNALPSFRSILFGRPVDAEMSSRRRWFLNFNLASLVLILLTSSLYYADILLIRPFRSAAETGFYKAALNLAEFLWVVPFAVQTLLVHRSSRLWETESAEALSKVAARAVRYTILVVCYLAVTLWLSADALLPLYYGQEFHRSVIPFYFLLPGVIGFATARPIFAIGQGKGAVWQLVRATGAAAGINLVLNLVLIPLYGSTGAAVATSIGYGSMLIMHVRCARTIGFDPLSDLRLRPLLVALLAFLAVLATPALLIDDSILRLVVVTAVGLMSYFRIAVLSGVLDAHEIDKVRAELPGPLARAVTVLTAPFAPGPD